MRLGKSISLSTTFGLSLLLAGTWPSVVLAEEEEVEELVVIGTRAQPRSVMDSSVPIDVIDSESLTNQGSGDMNFMLRTLVPSFHVNMQPGRDTAALQNPVNLRGLAPDQALVLVNGKRRHRGATITWISDGRSDGAQGPDLSVIPGIALRQVEVLRDGASAQYGSDAIAGVINFALKDDAEGAELDFRYGWYDEDSDETKTRVAGNLGMPLTERGFANFSFEHSEVEETDRSVLRDDVRGMIAGGNTHIADPAHRWGSPDIDGDIKTFLNLGMDLGVDHQAYAFGNYARREVETGFFYREPEDENGVFAVDKTFTDGGDEETVKIPLIFDRTDPDADYRAADAAGTCAQYADSVDDAINNAGLPPDLEGLLADDNCFTYHEWLPGGFQPLFGGKVTDYSLVAGMKGTWAAIGNGLSYDLSFSFGENEAEYFIHNTLNPTWGPDSPTSFDLGSYIQRETNVNLDLLYFAEVGLASDLSVAVGFEWREEEFEVTQGQRESWFRGDYVSIGASNGSNGFGGFSETESGKWDRENIAAYLDMEVDVTPDWTVGGAVRWEDFDDFGTETTAKFSTRLQATDTMALRASAGTGFRAPTPGQLNAYNVSTIYDPVSVEPVLTGAVPADHPLARAFGAQDLEPEESDNFSVGAVFDQGNFQLTVDYFRIDVDDRIFLSRRIPVKNEDGDETGETDIYVDHPDSTDGNIINFDGMDGRPELKKADFDYSEVQFFQNDFDTKTDGFDVVLTYEVESNLGETDFSLSYNRTETEVTRRSVDSTLNVQNFEGVTPESRFTAVVNHQSGPCHYLLRYHHFGSWRSWYDGGEDYDEYGLVDVAYAHEINSHASFQLGADNVFDQTPDRSVRAAGRGSKYPRFAPGGIDGRFLYGRVMLSF